MWLYHGNLIRDLLCFLISSFLPLRQLICMVGLVAFLSTQSEVAYIEDIPQVVGTNIEVRDILTLMNSF